VTYKRPRPSGPAAVSRCVWVGAERGAGLPTAPSSWACTTPPPPLQQYNTNTNNNVHIRLLLRLSGQVAAPLVVHGSVADTSASQPPGDIKADGEQHQHLCCYKSPIE
jgi:hypothetical protein